MEVFDACLNFKTPRAERQEGTNNLKSQWAHPYHLLCILYRRTWTYPNQGTYSSFGLVKNPLEVPWWSLQWDIQIQRFFNIIDMMQQYRRCPSPIYQPMLSLTHHIMGVPYWCEPLWSNLSLTLRGAFTGPGRGQISAEDGLIPAI